MDIVTRKQLNILIQLAQSDKHFATVEREMIFRIAKEKNFPESEVTKLITRPEPIDSLGALSADQKFDYLYNCVELILIDRKVFDSELKFVANIAIKLGFKKTVVDFLVSEQQHQEKEELRKTILQNFT